MSSVSDAQAVLSTMYSQLGPILIGQQSLFTPMFWDKSNIHVIDETAIYTPVRAGTTFAQTVRFTQPKRATLTSEYLMEITLSAATVIAGPGPGPAAAYSNNLGDQIAVNIIHRYANHVLHQYDGEYQQLWQRLTVNEVNEEGRNALTLGGLPITVAPGNPELQRSSLAATGALTIGLVLYVPLNRLWFSQHFDEAWMPEAFATEGEIEVELARLEDIVYSHDGVTNPFAVAADRPAITQIRLIAREITLTVPEKMSRLSYYETDRGNLVKFLDRERQRRVALVGTGALATTPPPNLNVALVPKHGSEERLLPNEDWTQL